MAPKRRNRVVGSVVKTKVVQETVQVTTAIVADDDQQPAAPAVEELPAGVNVSGSSTVVHVVEVTTPDRDTGAADVNVKQPKKRGRSRSNKTSAAKGNDPGKKTPTPPPATDEGEEAPVSLQSQETQDPNEHEAAEEDDDDGASKKKSRQQRQRQEEADEEEQPKTPRVASERKTKMNAEEQQQESGKKQQTRPRRRRRRLGELAAGGDAGMGGMGGYKRYVWRVLKQVHPELGMSGRAMQVLDMLMADMFERLASEAARLSKITGRMTLTSREVQTAVRLVLPGELGKHAISEGVKAISRYTAA